MFSTNCVIRAIVVTVPLAILSITTSLRGETRYNVAWTKLLSTTADDVGRGISVDGLGNIYVSGQTGGTLGASSAGFIDAFISKYDAAGNLAWTKQLGTSAFDSSFGVSHDGLGNVYIAGYTTGALGGTYAGSTDAFVSKYDSAGNIAWSRQFGTAVEEKALGVSADRLGNVFITGVKSLGTGQEDAFVNKYDAAGNLAWTKVWASVPAFPTSHTDVAYGVAADGLGNVYISGSTFTGIDRLDDAFLHKYDAAGNLLWTRKPGTNASDGSNAVAVDGLGNVYVSGFTTGNLGGANAGDGDAFVTKYDAAGNLIWSKQVGTAGRDISFGVSADGLGNIYISGYTDGTFGATTANPINAFVTKYDSAGNRAWTQEWGTNKHDYSNGVAADGLGNVYIAGYTGTSLVGSLSGADVLTAKLSPATTQNGGTFTAPASGLVVLEGAAAGNEPTRVLTGSATTSGVQVVVVGNATQGNLLVVNGGSKLTNSGNGTPYGAVGGQQVTYGSGYVGLNSGSSGTVTVTGANSEWSNASQLFVGVNGTGTLNVGDNGVVSAPTITIGATGSVHGDGGTLVGDVVNHGTVAPGNSPGLMTIDGDFANDGKLAIEIGGVAGSSYDKLIVNGNLSLGGTLQVSLLNGYTPSAGDEFDILDATTFSGEFAQLLLPAIGSLAWSTSQLYTTGVLSVTVPSHGDFNSDGSVDMGDYVLWRKKGLPVEKYEEWVHNYGSTQSGSGGAVGQRHVPEPAGAWVTLVMALGCVVASRQIRGA